MTHAETARAFSGTRNAVAAWEDDGGASAVDAVGSRNIVSEAPPERRATDRRRLRDRRVARRIDSGGKTAPAIDRTTSVSPAWRRCR